MALAQVTPPGPTGQAKLPPAATEPVDVSALAYYASNHDAPRVEAELRRLRSLYPNWQPPADPAALAVAPQGSSEDAPLWELFGADRLDDLDAEIARRKAANPAWEPPAELVGKLAAKRARLDLLAASDRKDYPAVLDIASRVPALVTPDDLDVSWRVADAYGRSGASDKALRVDLAILDNTRDPAARLATVRKAMVSLAPTDLDRLLGKGHPDAAGRPEFDAVAIDLVRQRVGRVLAGNATETPAPQDLAQLETAAQRGGGGDAALLGWWFSKRQDWPQANTWFQVALKSGPAPAQAKPEDAKVAQGAALALKAVGHPDDAESLAYAWRDADPALALLYIDTVEADLTRPKPVAVEAGRLKRFSDVVMSQQSGEGAQALGWYAYNVGQYEPAQAWFQKAMAWRPRDTTALGLALSLKQLGDKPALAAFLRDNGATFPALASLSSGETLKSGPAAPVRRRIVPTSPDASMPTRREQPDVGERPARRRVNAAARQTTCSAPAAGGGGRLTAMAALQAGWCLMALNRPQEAAIAFSAARDSAATRVDASYGEALAALRSNRTDQAVTAASSTDLASNRRNEVGLAALAQTAATTFDEGRYTDTLRALDRRRAFTAEPRDLTVLRAWSLFHTGRVEEARSLFSALDAQLSTSETRTGVAETVERSRY